MKARFSSQVPSMQSILLLTAVAITSLLGNAHAQKPFEGTIHCTMKTQLLDDEKHDMAINWKAGKTEIELDAGMQGKIRVIQDDLAKKRYMILDAMKMGMVNDIPTPAPVDENSESPLKSTGKHATIAGHKTEEFVADLPGEGNLHLWLASDFPQEVISSFMQAAATAANGGAAQTKIFKQISMNHQMFVKMSANVGEREMVTIELVKVEPKSLDDQLFVVPTDINFQPMPAGFPGSK